MDSTMNRTKILKLSYEPNQRNSSIINCLQICVNEQFGRHIVTTQSLKPGDVIAIERPFYRSLDMNAAGSRCAKCFKEKPSLAYCQSCQVLKFCSEKCKNEAWEEFHKFECCYLNKRSQDDAFLSAIERTLLKALKVCDGIDNLNQLIKAFPQPITAFDLDLNHHSVELDKKLVLVCNFLEAASPTEEEILFAKNFVEKHKVVRSLWQSNEQRDFLISYVIKLIGIFYRNSFTMSWKSKDESACGIFPFGSLFNHSCSPNVFRICIDDKFTFITKQPVAANEQLFFCYHDIFYNAPVEQRQKSISRQFGFKCNCEACEKRFPLAKDLKRFDENFIEPQIEDAQLVCGVIEKNWTYIENNINEYPCYEICRLMQANQKLIQNQLSDNNLSANETAKNI